MKSCIDIKPRFSNNYSVCFKLVVYSVEITKGLFERSSLLDTVQQRLELFVFFGRMSQYPCVREQYYAEIVSGHNAEEKISII